MKPEKFLNALNDIDGRYIREAREETAAVRRTGRRRFAVLIAAVVALMAMAVTAFAAEDIAGWFRQYFTQKTENGLTQQQIDYIEENEQIVAQSLESNGWTLELRSAITDGEKAYIIIGVTAPEDVSLEQRVENGVTQDWFNPGNSTLFNAEDFVIPSVPSVSIKENYYYQSRGDMGRRWRRLIQHKEHGHQSQPYEVLSHRTLRTGGPLWPRHHLHHSY